MPIKKKLTDSLQSNRVALLVQKNYDEVSRLIDDTIGNNKITLFNITPIIMSVMKYAEELDNLSGGSKKQMVLSLVTNIVQNKVDDESIRYQLILTINTMGPSMIDGIVGVANDPEVLLKLKAVKNKILSCC